MGDWMVGAITWLRISPVQICPVLNLSATSIGLMSETPATTGDIVVANEAPRAIGPYSQAVRAGGLLFNSGQVVCAGIWWFGHFWR
jgi:hypothetical protein